MIPDKIQALFDFIDFLDEKKEIYIEKYIPLCNELRELDRQRNVLRPNENYRDQLTYVKIQKQIKEKFEPISENIYKPITSKLRELGIWLGDDIYTSIWNNNISEISDFKRNFSEGDTEIVFQYKQKYLNFRTETNNNFLSLSLIFSNLDEILKVLFDFFKDTTENEFESFETKTVEVNSIADAVKGFADNKGKNVQYSIPQKSLFDYQNVKHYLPQSPSIKNEIIMGHKIQVGDITNNSGQIIIGNDIKISDSINGKNETTEKITELIDLIRQEQAIDGEQKQSLITNFDKVKEEVLEDKPDKSKIFKWLSTTKGILENFVLTHDVTDAVNWVYNNLNFLIH